MSWCNQELSDLNSDPHENPYLAPSSGKEPVARQVIGSRIALLFF